MSDLPPAQTPDDQTPDERDLSRQSRVTATGPWVWIILILMIGALVYAASAML